MTWTPLISALSPRTPTTRTPIRGSPGNKPLERGRDTGMGTNSAHAGRTYVKGPTLIGASTSALTGCRMADRQEGSAGAEGAGAGICVRHDQKFTGYRNGK